MFTTGESSNVGTRVELDVSGWCRSTCSFLPTSAIFECAYAEWKSLTLLFVDRPSIGHYGYGTEKTKPKK